MGCSHHVENTNNFISSSGNEKEEVKYCLFYKIVRNQISCMDTTLFFRKRKYIVHMNQIRSTFPERVTRTKHLYLILLTCILQ